MLASLTRQDYPLLRTTKVFIADAGSTDGTQEIALGFRDSLDVQVIPGGLPSVGRNAGARLADSRYLLFIDADMELDDPTLIRRALATMQRRKLQCLTTNIRCSNGRIKDHALYAGNNLVQRFASFTKPFATGMFMLFEKKAFDRLGGFHERALYAEDYLLSKKVPVWRFGIVRGHILTSNRRFKKMGCFKIVRMFLRTAVNSWNESYFLRDHKYWQEPVSGSTQLSN
ncbi:MAG TPA: glycosyltransferase [Terriglobales bacterium]|nr:glycosyltransferase [Terriglobales bacterium]